MFNLGICIPTLELDARFLERCALTSFAFSSDAEQGLTCMTVNAFVEAFSPADTRSSSVEKNHTHGTSYGFSMHERRKTERERRREGWVGARSVSLRFSE